MTMADFDWKKLVASIAPVLGTALGGPLAGQAISILGQALGLGGDAGESDVAAAVASNRLTGDQLVAMRQADVAFQTRMRELDIDIEKLNADTEKAYLQDVQDARARQVAAKDTMPQQILYILLFVYVLEVVLFYFGKMPQDEFVRALMTRAFATVELGLSSAIAYFIGSSRGSKQSGDAVRKIAEQSTK
jgi:hypothetical protein